jgi:hypothetical protein
MTSFDEMMARLRTLAGDAPDPTCSTVGEEIDAMDWQFSELARRITELESYQDETAREYAAKAARRHLDVLVQRAYRAKLIAQGQHVAKPT